MYKTQRTSGRHLKCEQRKHETPQAIYTGAVRLNRKLGETHLKLMITWSVVCSQYQWGFLHMTFVKRAVVKKVSQNEKEKVKKKIQKTNTVTQKEVSFRHPVHLTEINCCSFTLMSVTPTLVFGSEGMSSLRLFNVEPKGNFLSWNIFILSGNSSLCSHRCCYYAATLLSF